MNIDLNSVGIKQLMDFESCHFCSSYENTTRLTLDNQAHTQRRFPSRFCFWALLDSIQLLRNLGNPETIDIVIRTIPKPNKLNYTWATKEQLEEHISYLHNFFDFKFQVFDRVSDEDLLDYIGSRSLEIYQDNPNPKVVTLWVKNLSTIQLKFTLFWIRYVTEISSCLIALDAYRIKQENLIEEENFVNLLLVVQAVAHNLLRGKFLNSDQRICAAHLISLEKLKERLNGPYSNYVSDLFGDGADLCDIVKCKYFDYGLPHNLYCVSENNPNVDLRNWFVHFQDRLPIYQEVYNYLKANEIKN